MMLQKNKRTRAGRKPQGAQSLIEYVLLIGIVTMVVIYMGTDFKRGLQSAIKVTADQMGQQSNADQDFTLQTQQGFLSSSVTNSWDSQQKLKKEWIGITTVQEAGITESQTQSITNQQFSN